jgi:hypothetical protein
MLGTAAAAAVLGKMSRSSRATKIVAAVARPLVRIAMKFPFAS